MTDDPSGQAGWPRRDVLKTLAMVAAAPLAAQASDKDQTPAVKSGAAIVAGRRDQRFDDGWRFLRGDAPGAELPEFNDASWRTLDLPHDFSVEDLPARSPDTNGEGVLWGTAVLPTRIGPFDTELSAGGRDTGWFVGGTGWYRKRFSAAALPADGQVEIVFDGVYMNSDVWLNGKLLGQHPYGYTSFAYDLTPRLRRNGDNVLAVRVRNEGRNSRWYSGSGIYRHVWLNATGSVRVPLWGVFVTTPEVSKATAAVKVAVQIENRAASAQDVTVRIRLLDPNDAQRRHARCAAIGRRRRQPPHGARRSPWLPRSLWSMGSPQLYRAEVSLLVGGHATDTAATSFGIRTVEVDAERGLRINGESVKLKGGCLHHDNGLLGACAIDRAEERRVELMKAHGFNAIRTAHNPPSSAFLDACDRLGMLVMDEAFDQWERQKAKNAQDYHLYFADWWQRDLSAMVLRDRNHPSVIMWSIGNEIPERAEARGVEIAKQLAEHIKSLDPTRPVTAAINGGRGGGEALDPAFQSLDVGGYNYLHQSLRGGPRPPAESRDPGNRVVPAAGLRRVGAPVEKHRVRHRGLRMDRHGPPGRVVDRQCPVEHAGRSRWRTGTRRGGAPGAGAAAPGGGRGASGGAGRRSGTARRGGAGRRSRGQATPARHPGGPGGFGGGSSISLPFPWFNCYCGDIDLIGQAKPQWYHRRVFWGLSKLEMAVQRPVPDGAHRGRQRVGLVRRDAELDVARQRRQDLEGPRVLVGRPGAPAAERQGDRRQAGVAGDRTEGRVRGPVCRRRIEGRRPGGGPADRGTLLQDGGQAGETAADGGSGLDPAGSKRPLVCDR